MGTAKHVRKAFEGIGTLLDVHLPPKKDAGPGDGAHRGFAFVQYADVADATKAIQKLNGTKICGRGVAVDMSVDAGLYNNLQREEQQQREPKKKEAKSKDSGFDKDEDED